MDLLTNNNQTSFKSLMEVIKYKYKHNNPNNLKMNDFMATIDINKEIDIIYDIDKDINMKYNNLIMKYI